MKSKNYKHFTIYYVILVALDGYTFCFSLKVSKTNISPRLVVSCLKLVNHLKIRSNNILVFSTRINLTEIYDQYIQSYLPIKLYGPSEYKEML